MSTVKILLWNFEGGAGEAEDFLFNLKVGTIGNFCIKKTDLNNLVRFALEMNRDHSVIFEIAPKYCILDSC